MAMEEMEDHTEHVQEHLLHEAQHGKDRLTLYVALTAAFLAAFAAVTSLMSGHHSNEAMLEQLKASDTWSYYQAKGIKAAVLTAKIDLLRSFDKKPTDEDVSKFSDYKKEQEELTDKAKELEKSSEAHLNRHLIFARGVTMFQLAIAIAAISALSRKRLFWFISLGFGSVGVFFLVAGFA